LDHQAPVKERTTLETLLNRCVLDLELRQVASKTIATFSCACRSFVEPRTSRELASVTREEIRGWIYGHGWEPKTQRGYLGALTQLFAWAVEEKYLAESPLRPDVRTGRRKSAIKLPKLVNKEPKIFTVEQIERLFKTALTHKQPGEDLVTGERGMLPVLRRLIGFIALATFGGIRPFELMRLETSAIDLSAGIVPLDAKVTKTNDRRVVELSPNCARVANGTQLRRDDWPKRIEDAGQLAHSSCIQQGYCRSRKNRTDFLRIPFSAFALYGG
jgi:integrase